MKNAINLIDDILKNMEYVRILFKRDKDITPLHTFDLVVKKLNKLRVMVDTEYLTPEQIREAVIKLEKSDLGYAGDQNSPIPIEHPTITGKDILSPFYRDSVGTEELHENTR